MRPYSAERVALLRGSIAEVPASGFTAKKLYNMLRTCVPTLRRATPLVRCTIVFYLM
jgi:hypothetical protein